MRLRLGQPISDGTSGMYAVNQRALGLLSDPYVCEAPEVEALMRITDAKLRLLEVPVHMRQREHGDPTPREKAPEHQPRCDQRKRVPKQIVRKLCGGTLRPQRMIERVCRR